VYRDAQKKQKKRRPPQKSGWQVGIPKVVQNCKPGILLRGHGHHRRHECWRGEGCPREEGCLLSTMSSLSFPFLPALLLLRMACYEGEGLLGFTLGMWYAGEGSYSTKNMEQLSSEQRINTGRATPRHLAGGRANVHDDPEPRCRRQEIAEFYRSAGEAVSTK